MNYFGTPTTDVSAEIAKLQAKIDGKRSRIAARPGQEQFAATLNKEIAELQSKMRDLDPTCKIDGEIQPEVKPFVRITRDPHRYDTQLVQALNLFKVAESMVDNVAATLQRYLKKGSLQTDKERLLLARTLAIQTNAVGNAKTAILEELLLGLIEEGVLVPAKTAPTKINANTAKTTTDMEVLTECAKSDNKSILQAVYENKLLATNESLFMEVDAKLQAMKENQ